MRLLLNNDGYHIQDGMRTSIPKEKLLEKLKTVCQKERLYREIDNIENVVYQYILRVEPLSPNSEELHFLEVRLHEPKYVKPIAETLHNLIPYYKCVVFSSAKKYLLFVDDPSLEISKFNYTEWQYLEEILFDENEITVDFPETIGIREATIRGLQENVWKVFSTHSNGTTYDSLRRIIDYFKIREKQEGKNLLRAAIREMVATDQIEYFNDNPFVEKEQADQQYVKINGQVYGYTELADDRFGIDRWFEQLSENEFTTPEETSELLEDAVKECDAGDPFLVGLYDDDEWAENNSYDDYEVHKARNVDLQEYSYYASIVRDYNKNKKATFKVKGCEQDVYYNEDNE